MDLTIATAAYMPSTAHTLESFWRLAFSLGRSTDWTVRRELVSNCPDLSSAINGLLHRFLHSDSDRLLLIDSDMAFTPEDAATLLSSEHDFVSGQYYRKSIGAGPACTPKAGGVQIGSYVEADVVGTGFLALTKSCVRRLADAYPDKTYLIDVGNTPNLGQLGVALASAQLYQGRWIIADEALCRNWQALGESIWIDTRVQLGHVGPYVYGAPHA